MPRRVVIFKGRAGWFSTGEFYGDKEELESIQSKDTCDVNWDRIAKLFQKVKTLDDFQKVACWATRQYHSSVTPAKQEEILKAMPLLAHQILNEHPDEMLIVYEDLGQTGIKTFCRCPNCGRAYPVTYKLDGTIDASVYQCLTCGVLLDWAEPMPSVDLWAEALEMYKAPPATYKVVTGQVSNSVAREHMGAPVKILKIVEYQHDQMIFEVQFRDRKTALVKSSELELAESQTQAS